MTGFRNTLVDKYLAIDWGEVYANLQGLEDMSRFAELVRRWLRDRAAP